MLTVFNKSDLQTDSVALARIRSLAPDGIFISCTEKSGFDQLLQAISLYARGRSHLTELVIPPDRQDLIALARAKLKIYEFMWEDNGTFTATVELTDILSHKFADYIRV